MFSIEDGIWNHQAASGLEAAVASVAQSRDVSGNLWAPLSERHPWLRNAPYPLGGRYNSLILNENGAPSERTIGYSQQVLLIPQKLSTP